MSSSSRSSRIKAQPGRFTRKSLFKRTTVCTLWIVIEVKRQLSGFSPSGFIIPSETISCTKSALAPLRWHNSTKEQWDSSSKTIPCKYMVESLLRLNPQFSSRIEGHFFRHSFVDFTLLICCRLRQGYLERDYLVSLAFLRRESFPF